jgi:hypothetical protein
MRRMAKRDIQISVKMEQKDFELFMKAAAHVWPKAPMSQSSIVLGLARIGAESVLPRTGKEKKS